MKYIFIILICFLSLTGYSQVIQNRSNASVTVQDARWKALLNLYIPLYLDTTSASAAKGIDSTGALIYTYSDQSLWYRVCCPKHWVKVGTGGSGSGQLFAVGDSTATGTRYFNQKKNAFIYDSAGSHIIVAYDTFNHYFTKFYLDTTYTYLQVSSNDFNAFGSISVTKNNATVSASSLDSGHQVVVNNGNVTIRDLRNHPSKLVVTGISTGTDTVFAPTRILVLQGDTIKSARYPSLSPTDTANLSYRIDTVGKIIYIDTTQYLRFNVTDSILYSIPVNGVFANGLISIGGINLLDSTLTILPNIVFVRNDTTYTLTSSASFIIHSTALNYYRTDLIYVDSNNVIQHLVGVEDTVITVPPPVPYKGIGIAVVNVHNGVINSTITPTANNWLVGGQSIAGDSSIGTLTNNGMLFKIGGVNRSIYPATGGFALYGIGTSQMNAIVSPLAGTIVYNNDSLAYCYWNGSAWLKFGSGGGGGSPQTWQQTLITGSALTQNNTIDGGNYHFVLKNANNLELYTPGQESYFQLSNKDVEIWAADSVTGDNPFFQATINSDPYPITARITSLNGTSLAKSSIWVTPENILFLHKPVDVGTGVPDDTLFLPYGGLIGQSGTSHYIPLTVNNTYADATGNITISAGGTITHAVDSIYTLTDSLLLVHTSPYNRTDTFSWRGSGGSSSSGGRFTTNGYGTFVDSTSSLYTVRADTSILQSKVGANLTYLKIVDTANMRSRLIAGIGISITGSYPNQTIANTSSGGGQADSAYFWPLNGKYTTYGNFLGIRNNHTLFFKTQDTVRMSLDSAYGGKLKIGDHNSTVGQTSITINPRILSINFNTAGSNDLDIGYNHGTGFSAYNNLISAYSDFTGKNANFDLIQPSTQYGSLTVTGGTYPSGVSTYFKNLYDPTPSRMLIYSDANTDRAPISLFPSGSKGSVIVGGSITDTVSTSSFTVIDVIKGSIPAPRMTTAQRTAITSGVKTGTTSGGTGYTNGTFNNTSFTGGTGTGAKANMTVSGGVVQTIGASSITAQGTGYIVGDVLSASLAGGSGFTFTITAITASGAEGIMVYDLTLHKHYGFDGTNWNALY